MMYEEFKESCKRYIERYARDMNKSFTQVLGDKIVKETCNYYKETMLDNNKVDNKELLC